jgi:uncharacterized protein YcaQ
VLKEITDKGPLMPKHFEFQQRKEEWKGNWYGPSLTKQTLRALWHSGLVMTAGRKNGQHLYDLTERVVPPLLYNQPRVDDRDAVRELIWERHKSMGLLRPSASSEVWSLEVLSPGRKYAIPELVAEGRLVPVDIEGIRAHATPEFLATLDLPTLTPRVLFVAPLDQFMWDRKMIAQLFDFGYIWEIYTPLAKRRWGYYVLPVLYGDKLVARVEFWCRAGVLEIRQWHFEEGKLKRAFWPALEYAMKKFMFYCSATSVSVAEHIDTIVREFLLSVGSQCVSAIDNGLYVSTT